MMNKFGVRIGLDDHIEINGQFGCVDFIGEEVLILTDEEGKHHRFAYPDIESVRVHRRFLDDSLAHINL